MSPSIAAVKTTDLSIHPASCADCACRPFTLYGDADPGTLTEVQRIRRGCRRVGARRMIARAGESPTEVCTLLEGWAYRFMLLPDGRRQILSYYLPGNLIAHEALYASRLHFSVQALTDVSLCMFDIHDIKRLIKENSAVERRIEHIYSQRAIASDNRLMDLGRRTAQEKVARLIMDLYARLKRRNLADRNRFWSPLRQEHIADTLGLTPVHVSRTLSALRKQQLMDIQDQTIVILDEPKMLLQAGIDEQEYIARSASSKSATNVI